MHLQEHPKSHPLRTNRLSRNYTSLHFRYHLSANRFNTRRGMSRVLAIRTPYQKSSALRHTLRRTRTISLTEKL
ncbi:hypothetical protein TNCV_891461 [Trichonephila clavipes]|nr:hypothetical protein TNCV_891461 [Trichonephila clavipes]